MSGISYQVQQNILNPAKIYSDTHFYQSFELDPNTATTVLGDPLKQSNIGIIIPVNGTSPIPNLVLYDNNMYDLQSAQFAMEMYYAQQSRLQTPNYSQQPGLQYVLYTSPMTINNSESWDVNYFTHMLKKGMSPIATNYSDDFSSLSQALAQYDVTVLSTTSIPKYYVEWFGYFQPPTTGSYQFNLTTNQKAYLWVGNVALVNYTIDNITPTTIANPTTLVAGTMYPIRIQYGATNQTCTSALSFIISCNGIPLASGTNGNGLLLNLTDNVSNKPYEPIQVHYALTSATDPNVPPLSPNQNMQFQLFYTTCNLINNYTNNQKIRMAKSNTNLKNYQFTIRTSGTNTPTLSISNTGSIVFGDQSIFTNQTALVQPLTSTNAYLLFNNGDLTLNMNNGTVNTIYWDLLNTTTYSTYGTTNIINQNNIATIPTVYINAIPNNDWLTLYNSAPTNATTLYYGQNLSGNSALYSSDGKSMLCIEGNDLNLYVSNNPPMRYYTFYSGTGSDDMNTFYLLSTKGDIKLGSTMLVDTQQQQLQNVPMGGNILKYTNDFKLYSGSAYSYPPVIDGTNYVGGNNTTDCDKQCIANNNCSHYYSDPNGLSNVGVNCILNNNNNSPAYLPIPNAISANTVNVAPSLFIRNKQIHSDCKINVYDVKYKTIGTGACTSSSSSTSAGCPTKGVRSSGNFVSTSMYSTYDLYSTANGEYNPIPSQEGPCGIPSVNQSMNTFSEFTQGPNTEGFSHRTKGLTHRKKENFVTGFDPSACQSMDEKQCIRSMQSNASAINQAYQTSTLNNIEVNQNYDSLSNIINTQFAPLYNKVNNNPQYNSIDQDGTLTQDQNSRKTLLNGMIEDTKDNLIRQNTNYILINICAAIFLVGFFTFVPE